MGHLLLQSQLMRVGVRESHHHHAPAQPVGEVDALGHFPADDGDKQGAAAPRAAAGLRAAGGFRLLLRAGQPGACAIDGIGVGGEHRLYVGCGARLAKRLLDGVELGPHACALPPGHQLSFVLEGRDEDDEAVGYGAGHMEQQLAELVHERGGGARAEGEGEWAATRAVAKDDREQALGRDDVVVGAGPHPPWWQSAEELLVEVVKGLHCATAEHDRARLRQDGRKIGGRVEVEHPEPGAASAPRRRHLRLRLGGSVDVQEHARVSVGVGERLEQSNDRVQGTPRDAV
mmetsp:Transcript_4924/g.16246  ORF Transcript_4924/g.16246 Transcript_4924/m.16246 type:complete len:288 (+) Transcript_4924:518-1381(+)|eukprot:scaffold5181_cov125-Isochrysis_galbana.AAC.11